LNSASTLTGSVGRIIAANSSEIRIGNPNANWPTNPSASTETTSPGTAITRIGTRFALNDPRSVVAAPSNNSGGRSTRRMRSCESWKGNRSIPTTVWITEIPNPASKSAIVYGKRPTFATKIPTPAAIMNTTSRSISVAATVCANIATGTPHGVLSPAFAGAASVRTGERTKPSVW